MQSPPQKGYLGDTPGYEIVYPPPQLVKLVYLLLWEEDIKPCLYNTRWVLIGESRPPSFPTFLRVADGSIEVACSGSRWSSKEDGATCWKPQPLKQTDKVTWSTGCRLER